MDALKWIFKATIVVALVFLGLKAEPKKQSGDEKADKAVVAFSLFGK